MTAPHDDNPLAATLAPGILIGGERRAASGPACDHHDPATGAVLASFALASASDIDAAVASARDARAGWRALPADQRGQVLHRFADLLMANAEELVVLAAYETGSPVSSGGGAVYLSSIWTRYYAGWIDKLDGYVVPVYPVPGFEYVVPEPYGVVGVIVPWNGPMMGMGQKAVPALAAGNTVVVKPPELAPSRACASPSSPSRPACRPACSTSRRAAPRRVMPSCGTATSTRCPSPVAPPRRVA